MGSANFYWLIALLLFGCILGGYGVKIFLFKKKARLVYEYLKLKTLKQGPILIEEHRPAIIKLVKTWTEDLWQEVDRLRVLDRQIVYYNE